VVFAVVQSNEGCVGKFEVDKWLLCNNCIVLPKPSPATNLPYAALITLLEAANYSTTVCDK
jgi:hypothetical protein